MLRTDTAKQTSGNLLGSLKYFIIEVSYVSQLSSLPVSFRAHTYIAHASPFTDKWENWGVENAVPTLPGEAR